MATAPSPGEEKFDRLPLTVTYDEAAKFTETYGFAGSTGLVLLEGQHLRPHKPLGSTALLFMHPASTLNHLPLPTALAAAGVPVLSCGSRYAKNDTALIMEKVALDLGAYVRHAREVLGYEHVVLAGWSGGGSLSLFYQAEAEGPTITQTPAGDPVDLTAAGLLPADGVMLLAAHLSRAHTLAEWIDPSVTDELHPERRDPALDLYDPANPHQPPYGADYIARFRAAQLARSRRITAWVLDELEARKRCNDGELERGFVVHRTMADPRWLDPALEPNDRKPGWCYLGDPRTVNVGPVGLARFSSLRSWLSQWSYDHSQADGPANAARIAVPLLLVENTADDAVPASHAPLLFEAVAAGHKEWQRIPGATHYYAGQPAHLAQALDVCIDWLRRNGFVS